MVAPGLRGVAVKQVKLTVKQRRARMLKELDAAVSYYSKDTDRRGVEMGREARKCTYYDKQSGAKCAVGRRMRKGVAEEAAIHCGHLCQVATRFGGSDKNLDAAFVPSAQGLAMKFWIELQMLHDKWQVWDLYKRKGLTEYGEAEVKGFKKRINAGEFDK